LVALKFVIACGGPGISLLAGQTAMNVFARHFKQDALADVDLIIKCLSGSQLEGSPATKRARHGRTGAAAAVAGEAAPTLPEDSTDDGGSEQLQLAAFPAHRLILFTSEYFEAQVSVLHVWRLAAGTS
jgi:hypothetical protein